MTIDQRKAEIPYVLVYSARLKIKFVNRKPSSSLRNAEPAKPKAAKKSNDATGKQPAAKKPTSQNQDSKLAKYSYRAYKPAPTVVYTQSEEEADELITTMKG